MDFVREVIPLAKLHLNLENDRHGPKPSEYECIQWFLTHYRKHIINLATDIAIHGLSPIDGILVLPGGDETTGEFDVWEGNRRVTALKLLDDPNRCHSTTDRQSFTKIRNKASVPLPQFVECTVAPSLEEAERLIELRHQGPQDGVGTVPWDANQKSLHQERLGKRGRYSFSQQVLDGIKDKLDDDTKKQISTQRFPISTLDRILKNTDAREFFGLSTEGGTPQCVLEEQEVLKGLIKVVSDIAQGELPVSKVYSSLDIKKYLEGFEKPNIPNKRKLLSDPMPLTSHRGVRVKLIKTKARSRPLSHERKKLIPSSVTYSIKDKRVNSIYAELRKLNVDTNKNAVAVLFRVFLELSIELYLEEHDISYSGNDKLRQKARKAVEDMSEHKWLKKAERKGIDVAINSRDYPNSVDTFHAYVHNRQYHPVPSELNIAWDNLQPFFDTLFAHIK